MVYMWVSTHDRKAAEQVRQRIFEKSPDSETIFPRFPDSYILDIQNAATKEAAGLFVIFESINT
jgi:hypothetical protein